jgi:hypothetical protein
MIEPAHHRLSISAQCRLLSISRSTYYYTPVPETEEMLALMRVIDAAFLDMPWEPGLALSAAQAGESDTFGFSRIEAHAYGQKSPLNQRVLGLSPSASTSFHL